MIDRIQRGSREYLNVIAEKYYDDIYRFCCYQTGDVQAAYDLAQETFLRFIRYVDRYEYKNLKGYLLTIAMNVCRDSFRGKAAPVSLEAWYEEDPGQAGVGDLSLEAAKSEQRDRLFHALEALPLIQREVIVLHCYYEIKYREIAAMLGVKTSTVKSRMKQGTEKLKRMLRKEDFYV